MNGKTIRLNRLFGAGRNAVVVAMDHGAEFGPIAGLIDFGAAINRVKEADAILLNPGMLPHCGSFFGENHAPKMVLRLTWITAYCFQWNYREAYTCKVMDADEALHHGADLVMACCLVNSGSEAIDRDNVRLFSELVTAAERAGVPLIGELYPVAAEELPQDQLHDTVYRGARILAELGADAIKTFYTGPRFPEVVEAVPAPVLVLGASKCPEEQDALDLAAQAVHSGARGVVFGRNVIQAKDPARFLQALKNVVQPGGGR